MIGRREIQISGRPAVRYVPLRREASREIWTPISLMVGEASLTAAARTLIRDLDQRFQLVLADIATITASDNEVMAIPDDMLRDIHARLARLHNEVVRLLDEPTPDDSVHIASKLLPAPLSRQQLRGARQLADLSMRELASLSKLSHRTIVGIESGATRYTHEATIEALISALLHAGIEVDSTGWMRFRRTGDAALTIIPG